MTRGVRGLTELARLYGVETAYEGMRGERHRADPDALVRVLQALGADPGEGRTAAAALERRRAELDALPVQPVLVAWDGRLPHVRVRTPDTTADRARVDLLLETGATETMTTRLEPVNLPARRGWQATHVVRTARTLPLGYHRVRIQVDGMAVESLVIAAPRRAYVDEEAREWGVFFPLYAVCSAASQGVGDYSDLARMARWTRELGGRFVSTLPLLDTFLDRPFDSSPYAPASRLMWSELHVDVTAVPGHASDGPAAAAAPPCRPDSLVEYGRIAAAKRDMLTHALRAARSDSDVVAGMKEFERDAPHARGYARFRAVCDRLRTGWPVWPDRLRDGDIRDTDFARDDYEYHLFAQWQADAQIARLADDTRGADLYLDLPLGVHADSYDAWQFRDVFATGVSAGAPPDPLFTGGQNWGFRPMHPGRLRASGYTYLIETVRHHLRHARMLRLDHVMSLYRLFWVPDGLDARRGVYVRYPEDELFAILTLESVRHAAVIIGEDLGTVPRAVRRLMDRHRIQRMHVVQYEARPDRRPASPVPDRSVVASLNTHDMPTFAGFWKGTEIDDQLDLGLIDEEGHAGALEERGALRRAISRDIGAGDVVGAGLARQRLLELLAASRARYVLVTLEDLWLEDRPQNVPGTSTERPNWRRRAARTLDDIMKDAAIRRMLGSIAQQRAAAARNTEEANG